MILSKQEILFILELMRQKFGFGYSDAPGVGALQAKLSILMEMAASVPSDLTVPK